MNKRCYSTVAPLLALALSVCSVAVSKEQQPAKLPALEADFLLYIAEMQQIEQQWLDPISIEQAPFERQPEPKKNSVAIPSNNAMNDNNEKKQLNHQVNALNNKGVK